MPLSPPPLPPLPTTTPLLLLLVDAEVVDGGFDDVLLEEVARLDKDGVDTDIVTVGGALSSALTPDEDDEPTGDFILAEPTPAAATVAVVEVMLATPAATGAG
jgi:hypothetical protein